MRRYEVTVIYTFDWDEEKEPEKLTRLLDAPVHTGWDDIINAILDGSYQRQVLVKRLS